MYESASNGAVDEVNPKYKISLIENWFHTVRLNSGLTMRQTHSVKIHFLIYIDTMDKTCTGCVMHTKTQQTKYFYGACRGALPCVSESRQWICSNEHKFWHNPDSGARLENV